jgi:hypothetical protein
VRRVPPGTFSRAPGYCARSCRKPMSTSRLPTCCLLRIGCIIPRPDYPDSPPTQLRLTGPGRSRTRCDRMSGGPCFVRAHRPQPRPIGRRPPARQGIPAETALDGTCPPRSSSRSDRSDQTAAIASATTALVSSKKSSRSIQSR